MEPSTPKPRGKSSESSFTIPVTPLLKQIGYGTGVGVYHMDRSPKSGSIQSPWALKKLNKNVKTAYAQRLKKEAEILKSISHPNIVGFRGFTNTDDGREVLAMEECTNCLGVLLERRLEMELGPLKPHHIYSVIAGICKALDYLHSERNLLHGDIKSYNVLIKGEFEAAKLCDFGVSLDLNEKGEAHVESYTGTDCWSAPEVFGDGPITLKADIFSTGLVIWEMLALQVPHAPSFSETPTTSSPDEELEYQIKVEEFGTRPSLDGIPLSPEYLTIIEIFKWCTEKEEDKRPTAREILSSLIGLWE